MLLGVARELVEPAAKRDAAAALVEHMVVGRSRVARAPTDAELAATRMLALPIDEGSVKVRAGGPIEDEADYAVACWSGQLPLALATGAPIPDPRTREPLPPPLADWLTATLRRRS
jgi:hypothetical protein